MRTIERLEDQWDRFVWLREDVFLSPASEERDRKRREARKLREQLRRAGIEVELLS